MKFIAGIVIGVILSLSIVFAGAYFLFNGKLPAQQNTQPANRAAQKYAAAQNNFAAPQIPQTPAEMLSALDKMIAANPADYSALITKASLLAQMGENGEALKFYDKAIAVNPTDPAAYYSRALSYFALGDIKSANDDLSTALTLNPQMAEAYYNRGVTNLNLSKFNTAAVDFSKAAQLFYGKDKTSYNQSVQAANAVKVYARNLAAAKRGNKQAAAAVKKQNPKELVSVKRDDDILKRNKSDLIAGLKTGGPNGLAEKFKAFSSGAQGGMGYDENSFATLQDSMNKAIKESGERQQNMPKNVLDYRSDAQKNMAAGNYKGAVSDIDKALEKTPKDGSLYAERAKANMAQNNTAEAIKDLSKAIELDPNDASAYYNRANQKSLLGDNKGAIADAQKAQEIFEQQNNPQGKEQAENLSNMLQGKMVKTTKADTEAQRLLAEGSNAYSKGDYKTAVDNFNALIQRQPDIPELYYNRAIANAANGDEEAALKDYNSALARNDNLPDAHVGAASILLKQGKDQEAMKHIDKSIEQNPENPNSYLMRAAHNAQQIKENQPPQVQEQYKNKAVEDYDKAITLDPQNGPAHFYRGILSGNKEDINKAQELAKQQNNTQLLQLISQYTQQAAMQEAGQ